MKFPLVLLTSLGATFAHAEDAGKQTVSVNDVFGRFGFTTSATVNNAACRVVGTLDQKAFIANVPALQALDMLNRELSRADINTKPTMLAVAFTMEMEPVVTKETFDAHPDATVCAFIYNLREANLYGHTVDSKILSYSFDRATYQKIEWDNFDSKNLPQVARHFTLDPAMMSRVDVEAQGRTYFNH